MGKAKKVTASKGRKTKAKKDEAVEVVAAPEPEDDDFEVKVDIAPKPTRGRKRKTDETIDLSASVAESQQPAKRRATRNRASTTVEESTITNPDETVQSVTVEDAPKPKARKRGRSSVARSTRKMSAVPVPSVQELIPNDEDIDAALEADLERPLTDDEAPPVPPKKGNRSSKITKAGHAMFGTEPMDIDEAAIESELQAMEAESKPLPKATGAKGKQPRKVSAKQQAAARKAAEAEAEAEAEAQRLAEEEASQQIVAELEHSLSIHHSPIVQPKKKRASSRQPSRQLPGRRTRGSVMSVNESAIETSDEFQDAFDDQKDDSGNETDASMASQSTVVRGASTRRGSMMKKGKGGKKAVSRNIEEIVRKQKDNAPKDDEPPIAVVEPPQPMQIDKSMAQEEAFYTPALEASAPVIEEPIKATKANAAPKGRGRGRPTKAAPAPRIEEVLIEPKPVQEEPEEAPAQPQRTTGKGKGKGKAAAPRSPTPPAKETTPAESPQSSDAENHPPSSKPTASAKKPFTPHAATTRIPLAASTPVMSPSKRNVIAGLQSTHQWTAVDLDAALLKSPSDENAGMGIFGEAVQKAKSGDLNSPEKKMTVEEWIHYIAGMAEEKLRNECERMVSTFEREGGRAMRALEGVECGE
jgi:hypothetical protein